MHSQMKVIGLGVALCVVVGCSSGGDNEPAAAVDPKTPEGVWTGRTGIGRTVFGAVMENGEYWMLYSLTGKSTILGGGFQGKTPMGGGVFSDGTAQDFDICCVGSTTTRVTGQYVFQENLSGSFLHTLGPAAGAGDSFFFNFVKGTETPLDINAIVGTYQGTSDYFGIPIPLTMTIAQGGSFTATVRGWDWGNGQRLGQVQGTITPAENGAKFHVDFHTVPVAGLPFKGVLFLDPATNHLGMMGITEGGDYAAFFWGSR